LELLGRLGGMRQSVLWLESFRLKILIIRADSFQVKFGCSCIAVFACSFGEFLGKLLIEEAACGCYFPQE
jgi:hypothetical protein